MKQLLLLVALLCLFSSHAQPSHSSFNTLLQKHVSTEGKVNYKGLKIDIQVLDDYLKILENNFPTNSWSANSTKAFWINAYNAYTLKLMVNHYPLKNITDLKYNGTSAWDYKWIKMNGENLSLNDIEHKKLRAKYKDARIHFVVNCASFSCPILLNKAFTEENISHLMNQQAEKFINDSSRNKITANEVQLSEIFKWYSEDFTTKNGIIDFLNKYSEIQINSAAKISYLPYNWKINE